MHVPSSTRRQFVKVLAFGTASAFFMGKPWRQIVLAEGQPPASPFDARFQINLNDYPPLLNDYGSVRLGVNPMFDYTTPDGPFWPLVISRAPGDVFYVLDSACTHAGCAVPIYADGAIACPCHGSIYDIDGTVLAGPASSSLTRYNSHFDGANTLTIDWTGLAFSVTATVPVGGVPTEIQLDFPTQFNVEYEVRHRQRIQDDWAVVPFSLSPGVPPDRVSLIGNGGPALVVVPVRIVSGTRAPTGFYAVAIKLLDVS